MPASRSARAGARWRWPCPSVRATARSPTTTSRRCASGSWRRWGSLELSCVAEPGAAAHDLGSGDPEVPRSSERVIVAGATGFAGALAAHLLWRHPRFELVAVTGRSDVGRRLDDLYPRYRVPLEIEPLDLDGLDRIEAAGVGHAHR